MKKVRQKLTLDRPVTYQIKVPGELDASWTDWAGGMALTVKSEGDVPPVTTLTGVVDQAALQGLLRRLYSVGLPLISVICVDCGWCVARYKWITCFNLANDMEESTKGKRTCEFVTGCIASCRGCLFQ